MKSFLVFICTASLAAASTLPDLPQAATSFGAAMLDDWLYVYGGNTGRAHEFHRDSIKGDFFRLNLRDGQTWEKLPGDLPLLGSALVSHGGWIYRIGGMQARNAKGEENDLHSTAIAARFHPGEKRWETLPPLPEARSSHDAAILDDRLYVAGGWTLTGADGEGSAVQWQRSMCVLDLRAIDRGWQILPQNFQRRALAVVAHAGRLWCLGGMARNDEPSLAVDWFDPRAGSSGTWGKGPELPKAPMAGFGMAACAVGERLIASPLSGKLLALDAAQKQWLPVGELVTPRFFHRLLPLAVGAQEAVEKLVAVGGSNGKSGHIRALEIFSLAPPTAEASWPQWRGLERDGISPEKGWRKDWPADGPPLLWRTKTGVGMSSCVVADGLLFTQGNDGQGTDFIIALEIGTGAERWRYSFPCATSPHEMPNVPPGPAATPTISGGAVFALSREGDLIALKASSGELLWKKHLVHDLGGKRPVYGYSQSPLVDRRAIYLDLGAAKGVEGSTVALDVASGGLLWRAGIGEAGYSSARIFTREGRRYVAMFKGEALDLFDPSDGKVAWTFPTTARDFTNATTPALIGHRLLVSNLGPDESAALIDWDPGAVPNARPTWRHKQFALLFNSAIPHAESLFAFNEKRRGHHEFTCLDAETGATRWVSDAVPTGTFILADGHWLFLTRDGEVVLAPANSEALRPSGKFRAFTGKCYATPALAGSSLFVRSNEGEIAAYDLRATALSPHP